MRYRIKLGIRHGRLVFNVWDDSRNCLVDWFTTEEAARLVCEPLNLGDVDPAYVTPQSFVVAYRIELRRAIRAERLAMSGSVLGLGTPKRYNPTTGKMEDGPIANWQAARLKPYEAAKRQAEKQLKALEKIAPTPAFWQPRKETKQDKRIAKQYKPGGTFSNHRMMTVRDADFYRLRWEHKHKRQLKALKRIEDARFRAEMMERMAADDAARAAAAAAELAKPPALRDRLIAPTMRRRGSAGSA
jgi:hypothetical protein